MTLLGAITTKAQSTDPIPGDLLIMLTPSGSAAKVAEDLGTWNGTATGLKVVQRISAPMRIWQLHFDPERARQEDMLRAVRSHAQVLLAQNNHELELRSIPNDTLYDRQWHHQNINSAGAWDISTGGLTADGDTIVVCIIEGAVLTHEDLVANAWYNHHEVPGNGVDDDGNGYVDDFRGWNPNAGTDQVYSGSHGTKAAGMIGATGNNELGVAGANWAVKIMPVFNSGTSEAGVFASHSYPLAMRRLYNATDGALGAFVVATSISWGLNGGRPANAPIWCAMYDSLGAAGVLSCAATSNSAVDVDTYGDLPTSCPGEFLISVTATDINDQRTFSGYGRTTIDVGAPGASVYTTDINNNYGMGNGTSFAAPLTAGVVGLLYSAPCSSLMTLVKGDPAQGARYIRDVLFAGVDQVGNLPGNTVTGGRINARNSMQLVMAECGLCPAPYGLSAQALTMNSTQLAWRAVSGERFDLRHRSAGSEEWSTVTDLAGMDFLFDGIEPCAPYEFQVRAQCAEDTSAYSNLFAWNSDGCCVAPSGLASGFAGDNIVNLFWDPVLAASSYDLRYIPVGGTVFTVVATITGTHVELIPLDPCTNYNVQVRSICNGTATEWSAPILIGTLGCGACTDLPYCGTMGGNAENEWIARVRLGLIDNISGSDNGYGDYTDVTTELQVGRSHALLLQPDFRNFQFSEWFHVWIDLDQNGTFDAPDELVFDSGGASSEPVDAVLDIPSNTVLGPTRMRVIMHYSQAPEEPCAEQFNYGEVEDYCVKFVEGDVGMAGHEASSTALVFPQPADGMVTIRTASGSAGDVLRIVDAAGRLTHATRMAGTELVFDTGVLASGTYTIVIVHGTGSVERGRMVVAHTR